HFLLTDPEQPGYSIESHLLNQSYIDWAFEQADKVIDRTVQSINENDRLFIISDHGLEPIHTRLAPNKELEQAGLLAVNDDGTIDNSKTKVYAVASGTIAHLYVNLKGREKKGIVEEKDYEQVKQQAIQHFRTLD